MLGLGLAQREVVAAHLDLQRIAQWCGADERDACAGDEAHLTQAEEGRAGLGKFADDGGSADGQF